MQEIDKQRKMKESLQAFQRLLEIMNELREKCPWDKEQSFESLRANTIEEVYELSDAILKKDTTEIKKELGDILLHVVFYSKIASETNSFDIAEVCNTLSDKLIFRHPHVFKQEELNSSVKVEESWEKIKLKEKGGNKTVLSGVPKSLPSMIKAYRIQDKVRNVGFDWEEKEQVWDKVEEELNEFKVELYAMNKERMTAELGDLFFSLINAARLYKINPDEALERTNQKFMNRFSYLESKTISKGQSLSDMSLEEMEKIWQEAKSQE